MGCVLCWSYAPNAPPVSFAVDSSAVVAAAAVVAPVAVAFVVLVDKECSALVPLQSNEQEAAAVGELLALDDSESAEK